VCAQVETLTHVCFLSACVCQLMMENIHSETYSKLIDTLIKDLRLRAEAFRATETMPAVNKKAAWAYRWITSSRSFAERLVAFAAVEGLFFSSSFCSIFWMKRRGKMPGLCQSNELISRDEGLHQQFACLLYSMLQEKLSREAVYEIVEWAVEIECGFVREALPWELRGMNAELMQDYVEYCADILLQQLGYAKRWHTPNPFDWMEAISLQGKTNFFEKKVTDYQLKGVMDELAKLEVEFNARKAAEAEAASGATPAPDDGVNASSTSQDSGDGSDLDCSAASASSTDTVGGTPTHHKHQLLPAMAAMTPTSVPGGLSFDEEF
jgi:ribonucleotide reductase beta subunit family protein with ferritin-like domain